MNYPLVCVEFLDTEISTGWKQLGAMGAGDLKAMAVGWLVTESYDTITLATIVSGDEGNGEITIPRAAVTDWWEIT